MAAALARAHDNPRKTDAKATEPTPAPAGASADGVDRTLADFLDKDAAAALKDRKFGLAISLYRGIVAIRGAADPAVWSLVEAWQLAGENESAIEELERFAAATKDEAEATKARAKIAEIEKLVAGFSSSVFEVTAAAKQAETAFKKGRGFFDKKQYAEAVALFRAGIEMAPDLPGNYRELGEAYDKLGRSQEATEFFVRYVKMRPFGKNADEVRKRLEKAGEVGKLSVETSFPCDQVLMNRQLLTQKLPVKDMVVAPGKYKLLCVNTKYHLAHYIRAEVPKGGSAKAVFAWAVFLNKLDPWGRISIENPADPTQMKDVGLFDEFGVAVPDDRRALKLKLTSGDRTKSEERLIKVEPGKTIELTWSE
jgi:tetratricopeptide (TPR) repeat protein